MDRNIKQRPGMHVDHIDCDGRVSALEAMRKKAMPENPDYFFVGLKCEIETGVAELR